MSPEHAKYPSCSGSIQSGEDIQRGQVDEDEGQPGKPRVILLAGKLESIITFFKNCAGEVKAQETILLFRDSLDNSF